MWQCCIIFLSANHISDEQWDKEQERVREKRRRNLRNFSEEILERSQGRENFNENQRKAAHRWFSWLQAVTWEVAGSNPGRINTRDLKVTEEKVLPLKFHLPNG